MTQYEYKVVPAPAQGMKAKGIKTPQDRFANALETTMNALAAKGWEYLRADTLPCEKRSGLTGKTTTFQHMLVFRRTVEQEAPTLPIVAPIDTTEPARSEEQAEQTAPPQDGSDITPAADDLPNPDAKPLDDDTARKDPPVAAE